MRRQRDKRAHVNFWFHAGDEGGLEAVTKVPCLNLTVHPPPDQLPIQTLHSASPLLTVIVCKKMLSFLTYKVVFPMSTGCAT